MSGPTGPLIRVAGVSPAHEKAPANAGETPATRIALIINADDLGWTEGVNAGIFRAWREGVVTSATLAANMPEAEAAVAAVKAMIAEPPAGRRPMGVGIHLNACQGPAWSALGREMLADADGVMNLSATAVLRLCFLHPRRTLAAIRAEFQAQIEWFLGRDLTPTHADTHRHLHAWPPIFGIMVELCRRYHVPFIRRTRERLPAGLRPSTSAGRPEPAEERRTAPTEQLRTSRVINWLDRLNHWRAGRMQPTLGTLGVAHTGGISVEFLLAAIDSLEPGVTEIMVHPGYARGLSETQTRLLTCREAEMQALCDQRVRRRIEERKVVLTNYGQLR